MCWLHKRQCTWEEEPHLRKASIRLPVGKSVGIFLINGRGKKAQAFMGSATPGQVVLSYVGKQAEQAIGDKLVSSLFNLVN